MIALVLGLAAALGAFAAIRTSRLGAAARAEGAAALTARERRLTAAERSLRRALEEQPAAASAARAPRTVYVRPAPVVVHAHRHGDDEGEREEGGSDD